MTIKRILRQNPFISGYLQRRRITDWISNGRPIPVPHELKQIAILYYASINGLDVLVETGTFLGDTIWEQRNNFKKIFSIELSSDLYKLAKKRFKGFNHIRLLQGDSSVRLEEVMADLNSPALFWLDGHYSGGITAKGTKECPIFEELRHIFSCSFRHTILIDDARLFVGRDDYPTIIELNSFVAAESGYQFRVENDIIVLSHSLPKLPK